MSISEKKRATWLWIVVAIAAAYGLVNVTVYATTGAFGTAWFITSLIVYGALLASALALALIDPGRPQEEQTVEPQKGDQSDDEAAPSRPAILGRERIYETETGYVLRVRHGTNGHEAETLVAVTWEGTLTEQAIEDILDEVAYDLPTIDPAPEVDAILQAHGISRAPRIEAAKTPQPSDAQDGAHEHVDRSNTAEPQKVTP